MSKESWSQERFLLRVDSGFITEMGGSWGPSHLSAQRISKGSLLRSREEALSIAKLYFGSSVSPKKYEIFPVKVTVLVEGDFPSTMPQTESPVPSTTPVFNVSLGLDHFWHRQKNEYEAFCGKSIRHAYAEVRAPTCRECIHLQEIKDALQKAAPKTR